MSRLTIGLINNMPGAVMRRTEQRFAAMLARALPGYRIDLPCFALPGVERDALAQGWIAARHAPIDALFDTALDGLIVTGMEPCAGDLAQAPCWPHLAQVIDEAAARSVPSLWSCLAAHAAVLRLHGVERRARMEKLSGLYVTKPALAHRLTQGLPPHWLTPHSRRFGLDARDLAAAGYQVLTRARAPGWADGVVDAFVHPHHPFLFLQGHPEYDDHALLHEYLRDARRFFQGQAPLYPAPPVNYLDPVQAASLSLLQFRAEQAGPAETPLLLEELGALIRSATPRAHEFPGVATLFANWARGLHREAGRARRIRP